MTTETKQYLDCLFKEYIDTLDQQQIIEYQLSNKFNAPMETYDLWHISSKTLAYKLQLLEVAITEKHQKLGQPITKPFLEFVLEKRKELN